MDNPVGMCTDLSGQLFPPTCLSHLFGVLCMRGRELNSGMARDKGNFLLPCP